MGEVEGACAGGSLAGPHVRRNAIVTEAKSTSLTNSETKQRRGRRLVQSRGAALLFHKNRLPDVVAELGF